MKLQELLDLDKRLKIARKTDLKKNKIKNKGKKIKFAHGNDNTRKAR